MSIGKTLQGKIMMNERDGVVMSNQELLDWSMQKHPDAQTTLKCIAWYKSDLRKQGLLAKRGAGGAMTEEEEFLAECLKSQ